jgi:DNA primase
MIMPSVYGYITVEVDAADYEREITVEFDSIEEVFETMQRQGYDFSDILEYCTQEDLTSTLQDIADVLTYQEVLNIFTVKITHELERKHDQIEEMTKEIRRLEDEVKTYKNQEVATPTEHGV